MLATLADPPLAGASLIFEPKYDGIRAIAEIEPGRPRPRVRVWSRLGNEKTSQFPSIADALADFGDAVKEPLVIDGEIVALDRDGRPMGFQRLQGRIHLSDADDVARVEREQPVAFIAFDLLREGKDDLRGLPLTERRARLERLLAKSQSPAIRISEQVAGDGHALHERAKKEGWEGLIVKDAKSPYQSGRRGPSWRKLKLHHEQEFVVGGWTEPRNTRQVLWRVAARCVRRSGLGIRGSGLGRRQGAPQTQGSWCTSDTPEQDSISTSCSGCGSCSNRAQLGGRPLPIPSRATSRRTGSSPISWRRCALPSGPTTTSCGIRCIWVCEMTSAPKALSESQREPLRQRLRPERPRPGLMHPWLPASAGSRQRPRPERGAESPRESERGWGPREH